MFKILSFIFLLDLTFALGPTSTKQFRALKNVDANVWLASQPIIIQYIQ